MGFDPADPRCDPFYERMRALDMTLLAHTGDENALAAGRDDWGNPQRLRRALDLGLRVVFAHCATLGESEDLDDPRRGKVANFDLFLRILAEPRWRSLALGDLSAVYFRNRDPRVLRTLLERTDLHERLVQGTDWPLPAIRILTSTRKLEGAGLLTRDESRALEEVFEYDPWLFDLVLKRTLRGPHRSDLRVRHGPKQVAAETCSTGEQKALLIGLTLAEARLTAQLTSETPIVLLDEIAAHLDEVRRAALFAVLDDLGAQAFMTGTDAGVFAPLGDRAQRFAVRDATVTPA